MPARVVQPQRVRRLAVVDQVLNDGGGSRFVRALLPAMARVRPALEITLFANARSLIRDDIGDELRRAGIRVRPLAAQRLSDRGLLGIRGTARVIRLAQRRFAPALRPFPPAIHGDVRREIEQGLRGFDLAYFPWPFGFGRPDVAVPLACTVHDLNFQYFFGAPVWNPRATEEMQRSVGDWLAGAHAIVSSAFIAAEVGKFYPSAPPPTVIRLAPFSALAAESPEEARAIVAGAGIRGPYLLYPTHAMVHKNLGPLIAGFSLLKTRHPDLKLVFTGTGTDSATGRASPLGVERVPGDPDVIGLGYVSNRLMDALIVGATAMVSSSLYEAGSGPGLDAWPKGVPVAMSDIPPFREHLVVQGVHAELFDPRDPEDIARAIGRILDDPHRAASHAAASRDAIAAWTWERTAREYLDMFDAALEATRHG